MDVRLFTCPMHPEVEQAGPGTCPKCGMALEPRTVAAEGGEENAEYESMRRRYVVGAVLTGPLGCGGGAAATASR